MVELPESTLLVPPGWSGEVDDTGTIRLDEGAAPNVIDPVELQVLTGALRAICEEMGAVLIRSAHSANIKERRDASTALFDPRGEMVMQAEHIPVHLGAMPAAVAAVLEERHAPDRAWILNDPYRGGTHLPDITVITPICRRRRADRVRRQPRPPRRRRRPHAGLDARRQHHARGRGRRDRAAGARRGRDRRAERADAPARPAPRRPARPARGRPGRRRAAWLELHERFGAEQARGGVRGGSRLRRAADPRLPGGARGRHAHRHRRARGARGRPRDRAQRDRRRRLR